MKQKKNDSKKTKEKGASMSCVTSSSECKFTMSQVILVHEGEESLGVAKKRCEE